MSRRAFIPLLLLVAAGPAAAQDWRTLEVARQVHDSAPLGVHITYGAGKFGLGTAASPLLYQMKLKYPGSQASPRATYDAGAHTVQLGIHSRTFQIPGDNSQGSQMRVDLARGVPLDLSLELGATEADMDFGGLSVKGLRLKTGAADATLRFSAPNPVSMHEMMLTVGAAGFQATGLANAHADRITLRAGIGDWDLRFDGTWTGDMTLDAKVAMGALHVHVPADVRVDMNAKAIIGEVSNSTEEVSRDTSEDASDTTDNSDESDDSDSLTSAAQAKVKQYVTVHKAASASASAAATASASSRALHQAAGAHADHTAQAAAGPQTTPPRFTLHIVGGATLGSIEVDHDLTGAR